LQQGREAPPAVGGIGAIDLDQLVAIRRTTDDAYRSTRNPERAREQLDHRGIGGAPGRQSAHLDFDGIAVPSGNACTGSAWLDMKPQPQPSRRLGHHKLMDRKCQVPQALHQEYL